MGTYASWSADVLARYPSLSRVDSDAARVDSAWIAPAELELDAKLGAYFTAPFTPTNLTAKDLTVDLVYARWQRPHDGKKAKAIQDAIEARIEALIAGREVMVLDDGTQLAASGGGGAAFSNTANYHPIFGHGDTLAFRVDSDMVNDEENARD